MTDRENLEFMLEEIRQELNVKEVAMECGGYYLVWDGTELCKSEGET